MGWKGIYLQLNINYFYVNVDSIGWEEIACPYKYKIWAWWQESFTLSALAGCSWTINTLLGKIGVPKL